METSPILTCTVRVQCTVCLLPTRALGKLPARPQPHGFWSIHRWNCQWSHAKHWKENKETCLEGARRQVRRDSRRICLKESDESVSKHWDAQLRWIPVVCNLSQFPPINYLRTGGVRHHNLFLSYRRQFRSQTSDNMDRWKAEMGRVREKRRVEERRAEERRSEKRKSQKKEDAGARKGRKVAKHCVFPMICGSGGSKSRLAKAAGAEPSGQMRDEKLHAVVARSTFRKSKC